VFFVALILLCWASKFFKEGFEGEFYMRTVHQILCCLNLFWL